MEKVPVCLQVLFCGLLTVPQHYDAKHRFECTECDDKFTTEAARDEVRSFRRSPADGTDKVPQHYDESHRSIECPECDREFETQKAMNQVHVQSSPQRLPADNYSAL